MVLARLRSATSSCVSIIFCSCVSTCAASCHLAASLLGLLGRPEMTLLELGPALPGPWMSTGQCTRCQALQSLLSEQPGSPCGALMVAQLGFACWGCARLGSGQQCPLHPRCVCLALRAALQP